jgi:hypothetical protein
LFVLVSGGKALFQSVGAAFGFWRELCWWGWQGFEGIRESEACGRRAERRIQEGDIGRRRRGREGQRLGERGGGRGKKTRLGFCGRC